MTSTFSTTSPVVRVGIDIAKLTHQILWELPGGKRRSLRVANTKTEIDRFVGMLGALGWPCEIAFEATGDSHRPLAYVLGRAGFRPAEGDEWSPAAAGAAAARAGPPGATADRSVRHSSGVPGARERSGSSGSRTVDTAPRARA